MGNRFTVKRSKTKPKYWAVFDGKTETLYSYGGPRGKDNAKAKAATLNTNPPRD